MQPIERIQRATTSETVTAKVRQLIIDGELAGGERINEVRLSTALGVSRTPLREALNRLASEGALMSSPNLGYFVRPLTLEEFGQVYDIRPILDPEAMRLAGIPGPRRIARLKSLNRKLAQAAMPDDAVALDDEWHLELLADCPNRVLVEMIEGLMLRTRRYELALMRETQQVLRATADHDLVHKALAAGDIEAAAAALKHNLQSGRGPIIAWLAARQT
jgi:DNA-binding GntR family transcriptional regulator